jgi:hypothetical protein
MPGSTYSSKAVFDVNASMGVKKIEARRERADGSGDKRGLRERKKMGNNSNFFEVCFV